jgi:hypothetical protein
MKKSASLWLLAATVVPGTTYAESGVNLYGIVSSAVRYTSNLDGRHHDQVALVSGGMVGSRFGLRGPRTLGAATGPSSSSRPASAATMAARPTTHFSAARPGPVSPATGAV